ncbi:MAG TPA: sigma-70 family RNA polymerase sigma factor [Acidimicrobiales bacterium]|nr:sigma-70 family RNA polymerase sigma factor [Acidimicrobiales bacterium]
MTLGPAFDQILTAAQANAGWAFTRLYESLAPAVVGYLRSQGATDADDLTSEVFLGVFNGLGSFSGGETQFRSWVFTIAHRRLVDHRRSRARRPQPESLEERGCEGGLSAGADEVALASLGTQGVQRLLEELSPDQREVLALRVLADLTVEQVGETLGKAPGAVKALQRRALQALRKKLTEEGVPL